MKRVSRFWGDDPVYPYAVEHELDASGYKLLNGDEGSPGLKFLVWRDRKKRSRTLCVATHLLCCSVIELRLPVENYSKNDR